MYIIGDCVCLLLCVIVCYVGIDVVNDVDVGMSFTTCWWALYDCWFLKSCCMLCVVCMMFVVVC